MFKSIILAVCLCFCSVATAEFNLIEGTPKVSHYLTGPLNEVEVDLQNINKKFPKTNKAIAWCHINWDVGGITIKNDGTIEDVDIELRTTVNVPVWKDKDKATKKQQKQWDIFYNIVWDHEHTHRDIAVRYMKEARRTLIGMHLNDFDGVFNDYVELMNKEQKRYDRDFAKNPGYKSPSDYRVED